MLFQNAIPECYSRMLSLGARPRHRWVLTVTIHCSIYTPRVTVLYHVVQDATVSQLVFSAEYLVS